MAKKINSTGLTKENNENNAHKNARRILAPRFVNDSRILLSIRAVEIEYEKVKRNKTLHTDEILEFSSNSENAEGNITNLDLLTLLLIRIF